MSRKWSFLSDLEWPKQFMAIKEEKIVYKHQIVYLQTVDVVDILLNLMYFDTT